MWCHFQYIIEFIFFHRSLMKILKMPQMNRKPLNNENVATFIQPSSRQKLITFIINAFKRLRLFIKTKNRVSRFELNFRFYYSDNVSTPTWSSGGGEDGEREKKKFDKWKFVNARKFFHIFLWFRFAESHPFATLCCHMSSSYSLVSLSSHQED